MTKINHRRKNKLPVALRHDHYDNGYSIPATHRGFDRSEFRDKSRNEIANTDPSESFQRVGRTRYLDKSMYSWGRKSEFSDKFIGAAIGNDFSNGHRGMAKAVKGAKKYVRSRTRFHENAETKKLLLLDQIED